MTKDPKYDQFGGTGVIVAHTIWRLAKVVGACVMIHLGLSKNDTYPGICCLPLISKMAMEIHQKSTFFRWFLSILLKFSIFFLNFSNLFPWKWWWFTMISPGKLGRLPSLRPGTASGFKQRAVALHPAGWSGHRHLCGAGALWGPRPEIQGRSYMAMDQYLVPL